MEKPCGDFYPSTLRDDRAGGQCRECVRARVKRRRVEDIERVREYDRNRALLPHRVANAVRVTREWRRAHRDRLRAHNKAARTAIAAPPVCEGCGKPVRLEKHHHDYSRPLAVIWLCKPCHVVADKIRRRLEAAS
jgi:ribosomal protein L37AE/L43A